MRIWNPIRTKTAQHPIRKHLGHASHQLRQVRGCRSASSAVAAAANLLTEIPEGLETRWVMNSASKRQHIHAAHPPARLGCRQSLCPRQPRAGKLLGMAADELPSSKQRRNWFAVWRWPRWVLAVLIGIAPVGYLLSLPPIQYARMITRPNKQVSKAADLFLVPARACGRYSPIKQVHSWEWSALYAVFGHPPATQRPGMFGGQPKPRLDEEKLLKQIPRK